MALGDNPSNTTKTHIKRAPIRRPSEIRDPVISQHVNGTFVPGVERLGGLPGYPPSRIALRRAAKRSVLKKHMTCHDDSAHNHRLERCICVPECDGTGKRSRARPNSMAVIAALHDPLAIFLADNFSHVMTPDNDRPDGWTARVRSIVRP
jgi:hypothetical protein